MAVIAVERLTKRFGDVKAFDDISFHVDTGEIFGFLGLTGAIALFLVLTVAFAVVALY
jgi:ABC-2 type transport system ATP-binding protein